MPDRRGPPGILYIAQKLSGGPIKLPDIQQYFLMSDREFMIRSKLTWKAQ